MRLPMKLGKHVQDPTSEDCCLDRISSLPDELLGHLLSFLPTRCAVRTSTLSTRWRYLFTLTTCLSFDDSPCFDHCAERNEVIEATQRFKLFVDKVLELHQVSPIKKFSLLCKCTNDNSAFNRWVSVAVQKGVQELHCKLPNQYFCPTVAFTNLKILNLDRIIFIDFNSIQRLFSSCVLLEEFTLKSCACDARGHAIYRTGILKVLTVEECSFRFGTFEIDAPNLVYLTYSSNIGVKIVPSWKYSGAFIQAELSFTCDAYDIFDASENLVEYDRELLKAAAYKTTKLSFEMDSQKALLHMLGDDDQMPCFDSLLRLELEDCRYDSWKYVASLIDKSPQLETVIFGMGLHCYQCSSRYYLDRCSIDYQPPSDSPDIPLEALVPFSCHAQAIEVREFCGHKSSMSLMGHLLRNARVLKRLIVFTTCFFDMEEELKVIKDLSMLPRASLDCCLEINKVDKIKNVPNFHCMSYTEAPQK